MSVVVVLTLFRVLCFTLWRERMGRGCFPFPLFMLWFVSMFCFLYMTKCTYIKKKEGKSIVDLASFMVASITL